MAMSQAQDLPTAERTHAPLTAVPPPGVPKWTTAPGFPAPAAPRKLKDVGLDYQVLQGLVIKLAATVPSFSSQWAVQKLRMSLQIVEEICWKLKDERLLDITEQLGPYNYMYAPTQRCREFAKNLMELSGYVGPAPVSLDTYIAMLDYQCEQFPRPAAGEIEAALGEIVLTPHAVETASLAAASRRSLFAFGPAGNGKTSLGRCLQRTMSGDLWVPHCISIEHNIIRLFDAQIHEPIDDSDQQSTEIDHRWVRVRRPFAIAGGEMTLQEMDLAWSPSYRFYEAPPHLKANGGIFMIDDFGRQRIAPHELLNRWIVPMENHVDHLALVNGQKIQVPFNVMLIIATNLTVSQVADPAFLRRMGYRLFVEPPTPEAYRRIFERYASQHEIMLAPGLVDHVLARYAAEQRELRGSEPRDLLERAKDVCRLRHLPFQADQRIIETAWRGYFGNCS